MRLVLSNSICLTIGISLVPGSVVVLTRAAFTTRNINYGGATAFRSSVGSTTGGGAFLPSILSSSSSSSSSLSSSSTNNNEQPPSSDNYSSKQLVGLGMRSFQEGNVQGSIDYFDRADKMDASLRPYLWQRGISYYYMNRFQEGSDQFRNDVKVNPLDVEEIVWDIACTSRLMTSTKTNDGDAVVSLPPSNKMSLPPGRKDGRKIMGTVYSLFRGDGLTEQDLATAGHSGSPSDEFYSLFYLSLFCESRGETGKAENYMRSAVKSSYSQGRGAGDYMTSVAKVHSTLRGWN
mmetsp:Transcript_28244/g.33437  ORF Transcript_28244/g.33437 Transcript_28244/m.33437 type:complete len:291 (+) Transcript_28244:21-893(+)